MLNPATPAFVAGLNLPAGTQKDATDSYLTEPRGRWQGQGIVLAPASTDEIAQIVKACHDARVGIVPYSGGTGLVGGQMLQDGPAPIILSLERMNKIRAVYPTENVMTVDAGCILADVQAAAADVGRLFPLSLASEGSARIGGLLGTNAGGVNVLRYGNARALCLGLEVVQPDGTIWHGLTRLRKDNTGYDLRNLMIGAEGTLGVITGATLKLAPQPANIGAAYMAVPSPEAALDLLALAGEHLGDGLSAFEMIHRQGCRRDGAGHRARRRDRAIGRTARCILGRAREHPTGEPAHRIGVIARHFPAAVQDPRIHCRGRARLGQNWRFPHQLLWPFGRREPALQRLSGARKNPRGLRGGTWPCQNLRA